MCQKYKQTQNKQENPNDYKPLPQKRFSSLSTRTVEMFFQVILYFVLPLLVAFYVWGKKQLNSLQDKGFPCLPPSFPLGNMNGIGTKVNIVERNQEVYEAFKKSHKIAGFYSMLKATVMPLDLDLIKNILIKDFNNFTDRGVYYNKDVDPVSAHM